MIDEISRRDFVDRRSAGEAMLSLDVRDTLEHELAAVDNCWWISLAESQERMGDIDGSRPLIPRCRSGGRSLRVASDLNEQGGSKCSRISSAASSIGLRRSIQHCPLTEALPLTDGFADPLV